MANVSNPTKAKSDESFPGQQNLQQGATAVADRAKEAASYVSDKAKSAASSAMHSAEDAASYASHRAEDATHAVAGGLKSLGSTIRERGTGTNMAYVSDASTAVADGLESAGRYLDEEGLSGISEDMTNMIRRNPIPALLIGVGVGFLIARAMAPSRNSY